MNFIRERRDLSKKNVKEEMSVLKLTVSPAQPPIRRYGFSVYKNGALDREQVVVAGSAAIAEVKVWRYLAPDEYVWYAVPRLLEDVDAKAVEVA